MEKKVNGQAGPAAESNNGNDDDDYDYLALSLGPPIRSAPKPPKSDPDPASMHGVVRDQASRSFHPYIRPSPRNPNPNPNPNLASPSSVPDFSALFDVQNPNPNLASPSSVPDFSALFDVQNPNPSFPMSCPGTILPMPSPKNLAVRKRRNPASRGLRAEKSRTVAALYPWATNRRAGVHTLEHLAANGIEAVTGDVQCRQCEKRFEVGYDIRSAFSKLRDFIAQNKETLKDRSAPEWDNPAMLDCKICHSKESAKAVVAEKKKREINWLFLLLGGFLCCCTLEQLKYFCKHTGNHRTGAKNRVLYLTYLGLCKQLDPSGPFNVISD